MAAVGALCLAFAASPALAALTITKDKATKGDKVGFKIDGLQDGDIWELRVADGDAQTDSYLKDGFAEGVTEVQGDFGMPDLGASDKSIDIKAYIIRQGNTITPAGDFIVRTTYVAPVPSGTTGDSGAVGHGGTSTAAAAAPAVAQSSGTTGSTGSSSKQKQKKKQTSSKTKKQSTSNDDKKQSSGGSTQPDSTSSPTSTPVEEPVAAPVATVAPLDSGSVETSSPSTSTPSAPQAPPPGPGGPPPTDAVPPAPTPTAPSTGPAPVVPVSTSSPDGGSSLPIALVLLLGLLTLGGLGGAQARMLGLWGPQPRLSPAEARDARLLALGRVAQSGASLQRKIAEHKQTAKERHPLT